MTAPARTAVPAQSTSPDAERVPTDAAVASFALVQAVQAGDPAAFAQIYARYWRAVFLFVNSRVRHQHLAEDLTAETFLRAFRRVGVFTWQGADVGAWLVTIARNLVADHFKSARHRFEADVLVAELARDVPDQTPEGDPAATAAAAVDNAAVREALDAAMQLITPDQKRCLELRFFDGLSLAGTAAAMGRTPEVIKALQFRAVRSMARLLPTNLRDSR